ncbi:lysM and putative peptidoglycan-binding domain-containing protein 2 [Caerostris extrusa]|uniref:LysM and putative peptidoglycan-binding domain-containing protein 2 n=1 Tax=Caerostris extrusa TaxID=172846 RepID=A0AAV4NGN5_CAEEX|nr:lysM and putative peptidoglycan-binding domain-containing protein 2 [Caerostris extrusa]
MGKNMAAVAEHTEKISLGSYAKKHVRYGSMAKESGMKNEKYVKHIVQPGDTLQGLALRYGVTMEQIKRANKMWTADSLFLRSSLDIPVDKEALTVSSISCDSGSPQLSPVKHYENGDSFLNCQTSIDLSNQLNSSISDNGVEREESAADFLIRIDSHIAQTKDKVQRLQNKVVYSEDDLHNSRDGFSSHMSYQYQRNNLSGSSSLSNLNVDPSLTPQTVVMTKGRKVRSSLKKLEKQQDEIFEL